MAGWLARQGVYQALLAGSCLPLQFVFFVLLLAGLHHLIVGRLRDALAVKRLADTLLILAGGWVAPEAALARHVIGLHQTAEQRILVVGDIGVDRAAQFLARLVAMPLVDFIRIETGDQRQLARPFFHLVGVGLAQTGIVIENFADTLRGLIRIMHMA